jgi:hypothetical protein
MHRISPTVETVRRGLDRMVVGFTTTCAISAYHHYKCVSSNPSYDKVYSIQYNLVKFASDLCDVGGFLRFPPPIKLTTTI